LLGQQVFFLLELALQLLQTAHLTLVRVGLFVGGKGRRGSKSGHQHQGRQLGLRSAH